MWIEDTITSHNEHLVTGSVRARQMNGATTEAYMESLVESL